MLLYIYIANSFLKLFMVVVMKNINKDLINIRLANIYDLAELKTMYDKIVVNMHKNGINMWNDVYPYICFEERINNKNLYVMTYENEIIASFSLVNSIEDAKDFKWIGDKALYLGTVGVNVEFLKQIAFYNSYSYWFFSCYIITYIISPFLNKFIVNLDKKDSFVLLEKTK